MLTLHSHNVSAAMNVMFEVHDAHAINIETNTRYSPNTEILPRFIPSSFVQSLTMEFGPFCFIHQHAVDPTQGCMDCDREGDAALQNHLAQLAQEEELRRQEALASQMQQGIQYNVGQQGYGVQESLITGIMLLPILVTLRHSRIGILGDHSE